MFFTNSLMEDPTLRIMVLYEIIQPQLMKFPIWFVNVPAVNTLY